MHPLSTRPAEAKPTRSRKRSADAQMSRPSFQSLRDAFGRLLYVSLLKSIRRPYLRRRGGRATRGEQRDKNGQRGNK
jgi:hypothetical protein